MQTIQSMQKKTSSRFKFITRTFVIFIITSFITRTVLLMKSIDMVDISIMQLLKIYLLGSLYDFISISYLVIPFVIYLLIMPHRFWKLKINFYATYLFSFILIFLAVFYSFSEWFFWDEFSVRFNFIAVDYLVYTTEVIGNIRESYPMGILISIMLIITTLLFYFIYKYNYILSVLKDQSSFKQRLKPACIYLLLPILFSLTITQDFVKISKNQYNNELSKSGLYSLFAAFRNNTLDYDMFYATQDESTVFSNLKAQLSTKNTTFISSESIDIAHNVNNSGKEKNYNVMMIVVESLSGNYLASLGGTKALTPNLDALVDKSISFNNFYATGTRTVRGMEAITLSIPPTPGRSIVKRLDNHNMYSSGFIFRDKGYDTKFIYGGHGYFDNMNEFFSNNGFNIVDRTDFSDKEDTFHTTWGVCDEDLLNKTLQEADASFKEKKPFMSFVMTTSNHRPYDYPDGRIDIPSHSGRDGAVKYTDYALGDFLSKAEKKTWFKNTIFIIVADHCASSAGKTELPLEKYKIPMLVYAPSIFKPKVVDKIASQIDIMPTIFSMLNWSYISKFYGKDILSPDFEQRALIGTYQKLGLYKENVLTVLSPGKKVKSYEVIKEKNSKINYKDITVNSQLEDETVAYYQGASTLYKNKLDRYSK